MKIALYSLEFYAVCMILLGALIMLVSVFWVRKIQKLVPGNQSWKWHTLSYLMSFFLVGYILLGLIICYQWQIVNRDILTGMVFFGGAIFVFIVMDFSYGSIKQLLQMDELKRLNHLLEDKSQELAAANNKLKNTYEEVVNFTHIANDISQGNLDIEVPEIKSSPELLELSNSFGRMLESLKIAMKAMEK